MPERLSRKLGPLPVYAWALIAVGAFLLYRRYKGNAATGSAGSSPTGTNPVPFGDQASFGSGGIGNAQVPNAIQDVPGQNVTDSTQAAGGGTSSGGSDPTQAAGGATTPTSSAAVTTPTSSAAVTTPTAASYSRPVYLGPPSNPNAAAVQAQTSTTTSGRPTKVGGAYHPGQGFD